MVWYCPRWRKSREQVSEDQTKVTPTSPCLGSWHCHIHHQSYSRPHNQQPKIRPILTNSTNHQSFLDFWENIVKYGWYFAYFPSESLESESLEGTYPFQNRSSLPKDSPVLSLATVVSLNIREMMIKSYNCSRAGVLWPNMNDGLFWAAECDHLIKPNKTGSTVKQGI